MGVPRAAECGPAAKVCICSIVEVLVVAKEDLQSGAAAAAPEVPECDPAFDHCHRCLLGKFLFSRRCCVFFTRQDNCIVSSEINDPSSPEVKPLPPSPQGEPFCVSLLRVCLYRFRVGVLCFWNIFSLVRALSCRPSRGCRRPLNISLADPLFVIVIIRCPLPGTMPVKSSSVATLFSVENV